MSVQPSGARAKAFGAYYTDDAVAAFLTEWAVRDASSRVIDPSFGGGVFLEAASRRLRQLGGDPADQVYGVELDDDVHQTVGAEVSESHGINLQNLILSDFFDVDPGRLPLCDAVVGNPPFIRYQSFSGSTREKALARAAHQGVKLSSLVSSWAPFLVHSSAMLKRGGNLAMVIPMEIGHATYARPVLDYLSRAFARTTFLTFRVPLFPDLSQDTLLLLAERKGGQFEGLGWQDMSSLADLGTLDRTFKDRQVLDHGALASGDDRFITSFIDTRARDLYRELSSSADTAQLSELAQVGIGYVTGANDFFHLSSEDVAAFQIPLAIATRAVFRGRALTGLTFTESDWLAGADSGSAGYLLEVSPRTTLDDKTRSYVSYGVSIGVDKAYKCRVRSPWYSVPNVYRPEAFLTYMSGLRPRLVVNSAAVVAPNTLHTVRMRPLASLSPISLALAWQSSLASLSVEIEGHAMGGGMLKLEPKEAQKVVVPVAKGGTPDLRTEVDGLLRAGRNDTARQLVDETVLQNGLGLSAADCELLGAAAEQLRVRRYYRGRAA